MHVGTKGKARHGGGRKAPRHEGTEARRGKGKARRFRCGADTDRSEQRSVARRRFRFDIDARVERSRYTERELLDGLRRYARLVGWKRFTAREYNAWGGARPGVNTVRKRFGGWRAALARIGIGGVRAREYSAAELVERLERVWRKLGRAPGAVEMVKRGGFSISAYKRRWGSVRGACEAVARYHARRITKRELLRGDEVRGRKTLPLDVWWRVLKRDRYRCTACGASPARDAGVELHVDHVRPVSKGGGDGETNLRTLCARCNVGRSDERRTVAPCASDA